MIRSAEAVAHGDVAACEVDEQSRDEERGDFGVALGVWSD